MQASRTIVPAGPPAWAAPATDELLRSAFERSPTGISVVGVDGRWLRINDAYCRMLGYEREDLIGAAVWEFIHPGDAAEDREFMAAAMAGTSPRPCRVAP